MVPSMPVRPMMMARGAVAGWLTMGMVMAQRIMMIMVFNARDMELPTGQYAVAVVLD